MRQEGRFDIVYGKLEIYSTDESGRLNSALKFLPLPDFCRKLLSVLGGVSRSNYEPAPSSLIFLFFSIAAADTFNPDNFRVPETTHI